MAAQTQNWLEYLELMTVEHSDLSEVFVTPPGRLRERCRKNVRAEGWWGRVWNADFQA